MCVSGKGYLVLERGFEVSCLQTSDFSRGVQSYNPTSTLYKIREWCLSLGGSPPTYQASLLSWTLLLGLGTYH